MAARQVIKQEQSLCKAVLAQRWDEVIELYKSHPQIQAAKIAKSQDTALHVAISLGAPENIIIKLVDEIENTNVNDVQVARQTLEATNEQQDTPLHCAATRGSASICDRILRVHRDLASKPNEQGETPLFLAALNGHKRTFLYLHCFCNRIQNTTIQMQDTTNQTQNITAGTNKPCWRRTNGDTILHFTIQREYLDLALQIIHLYKKQKIVGAKDKDGDTPLLVLASIPSAFKSGTPMSLWQRLCYNFCRVEELKTEVDGQVIRNSGGLKADDPRKRHRRQGSIRKMKEKHVWSAQIVEELLRRTSEYGYQNLEQLSQGTSESDDSEHDSTNDKKSTPLLVAITNGQIELVKRILEVYPVAIYDKTDPRRRNVVLLAVEKRQTHVLKLLKNHPLWHILREDVDSEGNNVLHMASLLLHHMPRHVHGSVMQMQYEALWFKYVKDSMPAYLSSQINDDHNTPDEVFAKEHKDLLKESNEWLKDTSGSYAIVAALIVSVTYAASFTVPGGTDDTGKPILRGQLAFNVFAFSVLVAFCSSITSLAAFVAVFSSRKQAIDYLRSLPLKLCFGLTAFYLSVVSLLVSFCAAHFFELDQRIKHKISPYAMMLIPLCLYTFEQIPLYWNLLKTTCSNEPQPRYVGDNVAM
ncbi:uncharacterized protein LOC129290941 [Prosopis cineraria]|uniref:uncharacterized protein LOC129290941 n=1 Tax=Prosopis cineraria TaxID=364024 RepID=UPI00240F5F2B|nr:uncharacterized protein LOC129290941 [Prosopis cineraria]